MEIWWIDETKLLGSRNPSSEDLEHLRAEGFGVLVSLLKEDEQAPRYDVSRAKDLGFVRHNIPVADFSAPTIEQLEQFIELVAALPLDTKAIVHCEGGSGRTGTFAAAYWVARGMTVPDAIAHVRKAKPNAIETREQEAVLRAFAKKKEEEG